MNSIRSDEGLTLETSAFQIFHGGNFTFINSFDKTKFLLNGIALLKDNILNSFYHTLQISEFEASLNAKAALKNVLNSF